MPYDTLKLAHVGGVSWITLDRPPVNAVTVQLLEELLHALDTLEGRNQTRCIVRAGAGTKAFCAGADLSASAGSQAHGNNRFRALGRAALDRVETHPKPVFGALRGWCIAGGLAQALETRWAELNDASQDCQEGKAAFREKRTPVFKGL